MKRMCKITIALMAVCRASGRLPGNARAAGCDTKRLGADDREGAGDRFSAGNAGYFIAGANRCTGNAEIGEYRRQLYVIR